MQGGGDEEASPPMKEVPKAKRNALAANRLQWGISGVPPKIYSAGSPDAAGTELRVEAKEESPAVDITEAPASASGEQANAGRLGAELEELIRQARTKAASKAVAEKLKVGEQKAAAPGSTRLQLPGFQVRSACCHLLL